MEAFRSGRSFYRISEPRIALYEAAMCREWALTAPKGTFGEWPATVASGVVPDPANRAQIQIDVTVLGTEVAGYPRQLLSLGEVKWGEVMTPTTCGDCAGRSDRSRSEHGAVPWPSAGEVS
jgi:hypothetical protein